MQVHERGGPSEAPRARRALAGGGHPLLALQRGAGNAAVARLVQREVDTSPGLLPGEGAEAALGGFVGKKGAEQKVLGSRWNTTYQGANKELARNQGLAHILDYRFAAPMVGDAKEDVKLPAAMSGLSKVDERAHKRFLAGHAVTGAQVKAIFNKDPTAMPNHVVELPVGRLRMTDPEKAQLATWEEQLEAGKRAAKEPADKKAFAQGDGRALTEKIEALKTTVMRRSMFVRKQVQKNTRLDTLGAASGMPIARGDEVVGATAALDEMKKRAQDAGAAPKPLPGGATYRSEGWHPKAGGGWEETAKDLPNTAITADYKPKGLTSIKTFGTPGDEKYSSFF